MVLRMFLAFFKEKAETKMPGIGKPVLIAYNVYVHACI